MSWTYERVVFRSRALIEELKKTKEMSIPVAATKIGYSYNYFTSFILPLLMDIYGDCLVREKGKIKWVCDEKTEASTTQSN